MKFGESVPLSDDHDLESFDCGQLSLDVWLRETARHAERQNDARTYVVTDGSEVVVGYYCISTGSVARGESGGRFARNGPDPIPTIVVGRLAVDESVQGQGNGRWLAVDAIARATGATDTVGARAIVVNPIDEAARAFWIKMGFEELPKDRTTLFLRTQDAKRTFEDTN